jgi:putative selenate reductase FAD-binding subunit
MIEDFHRPKTIQEATGLKAKLKDAAVFIAGGTWVNARAYPLSPKHVISLKGLGLNAIEQKGGELFIGALCSLQDLIENARVPLPLKAAAEQIASRNIRNMATVGGHIARNDSRSDVIPMLLALEAQVELAVAGSKKRIDVADYIMDAKERLITQVIIPKLPSNRVAACRNIRGSSNGTSAVTAAVSMTVGKSCISEPIIALGGVAKRVVRLTSIEERLDSKPLASVDEIMKMVSDQVNPTSDILGGTEFKKYEAGVAVALAAHEALRQKGGLR